MEVPLQNSPLKSQYLRQSCCIARVVAAHLSSELWFTRYRGVSTGESSRTEAAVPGEEVPPRARLDG